MTTQNLPKGVKVKEILEVEVSADQCTEIIETFEHFINYDLPGQVILDNADGMGVNELDDLANIVGKEIAEICNVKYCIFYAN